MARARWRARARSIAAVAPAVAVAACGARPPEPGPALPDRSPPFTRVAVETAPGLSGLAVDAGGAIWTVAERAATAYRITLDAELRPHVTALPIEGVPAATDLEAIAVLDGGGFAFGTEGGAGGVATVLLAERRGDALAVTRTLALPRDAVGTSTANNHGAEGVCAAGGALVVAIEGAGVAGGRRWAPVIRMEGGRVARSHRVWLTTATGKLSALDCRLEAGALHVLAIERHFEVTRILELVLGDAVDVEPVVARDLGPAIQGQLNLEGLGRLPDGRVVAVVDNQWKRIRGPSELLVFPAGALR